jgi:hypothetical protein
MTVAELIEVLGRLPPDLNVRTNYDNGCGGPVEIGCMFIVDGELHLEASNEHFDSTANYECEKRGGQMLANYLEGKQ